MRSFRKKSISLAGSLLLGFILALACAPIHQAKAQGMPIVVAKTPNDPTVPTDGPNAGPNAGKLNAAQCTSGSALNCACDADLLNQIYARAYLESTRQNIQNETMMRKPDSVFEYTCFEDEVNRIGREAPDIFSESTNWHTSTISLRPSMGGTLTPGMPAVGLVPIPTVTIDVYMGSDRLTRDLERIIIPALNTWLTNFNHNYLGGAMTGSIAAGPGCGVMSGVWFYAKCEDFARDNIASFGHAWPTFEDLITTDPRQLPEACTAGTNIEQPMIDVSRNKDFLYVNFDNDDPTYIDRFFPAGSTPPEPPNCLPGIPTGVMVTRYRKTVDMLGNVTTNTTATFENRICPNPSCYWEDTVNQCLLNPP